jgi:membrane-bound lytic murein transglycosylase A
MPFPPRSLASAVIALCLIASAPAAALELKFRNAKVEALSFATLEGWKKDDHAVAFETFMNSCRAIRHGTKAMRKARPVYGGLYNACQNAIKLAAGGTVDSAQARTFFEDNFKPVRILPALHTYGYYTGADGFYTGYYEPVVAGSRLKTDEYNVPLYGVPGKIAGKKTKVFSQYDRHQIESGALAGKGLEICWIKSPIDAFFAQIQGSTRIKLNDGQLLRLNYIASNGQPYTPVGRILIDRGVYTPEEMTMDKIREYMEANPEEGKALRLKNRSFVFFSKTPLGPKDECIGAQGVPLTAGRSLAVDPKAHVYGTPVWIDAKFPIAGDEPKDAFRRLMVAQDTGSAIRGVARADIYFGHGGDIPSLAGRIKHFGKFVMLAPKDVSVSSADATPLPKPRPPELDAEEVMAKGRNADPAASAGVTLPLPTPRP